MEQIQFRGAFLDAAAIHWTSDRRGRYSFKAMLMVTLHYNLLSSCGICWAGERARYSSDGKVKYITLLL